MITYTNVRNPKNKSKKSYDGINDHINNRSLTITIRIDLHIKIKQCRCAHAAPRARLPILDFYSFFTLPKLSN